MRDYEKEIKDYLISEILNVIGKVKKRKDILSDHLILYKKDTIQDFHETELLTVLQAIDSTKYLEVYDEYKRRIEEERKEKILYNLKGFLELNPESFHVLKECDDYYIILKRLSYCEWRENKTTFAKYEQKDERVNWICFLLPLSDNITDETYIKYVELGVKVLTIRNYLDLEGKMIDLR